jgi:hypothetical protein
MKDVKLLFKVEKSWLAAQNMNENQVALFRWEGASWTEIKATKNKEDEKYVYFSSSLPGLSYFVVGKTTKVTPEPETPPVVTPPTQPPVTPPKQTTTDEPAKEAEETPPAPEPEKKNSWWIPLIIIVALGGLILFLLLKNRGKKGEAYIPPVVSQMEPPNPPEGYNREQPRY